MNQSFVTAYMDEALFDLPTVISQAIRDLADVEFDTIVGTGFSGGVVVPALAMAMEKDFVLVRKESDDSHHGKGRLMGRLGQRWLFVDDFVGSGRTRRYVIDKIASRQDYSLYPVENETEYVGTYMYINAMRGFDNPFRPASEHVL